MKKFLVVAAVILTVLIVVDLTVLKDDGILNQSGLTKYEEVDDVSQLPLGIEPGNIAPDFTLTDLNGNEVSLYDYRGKKVLLNFWATWCPPCKAEMPYMEEFYQKYQKDGFEILAVNATVTENSVADVKKFIADYELTFTIPMDERNQISSGYEILAFPTSFFIDSKGIIRSKVIGGMTKEFLEDEIKKLP